MDCINYGLKIVYTYAFHNALTQNDEIIIMKSQRNDRRVKLTTAKIMKGLRQSVDKSTAIMRRSIILLGLNNSQVYYWFN